MTFPIPPTRYEAEQPDPANPQSMADAIIRLSSFNIHRLFLEPVTVTAAYTVDPLNDSVILADASGGAFAVTIPAASDADAKPYIIKRLNAGANAVTVVAASGNIDGAASVVLTVQYQAVAPLSDGSNYWLIT